MSVATEQTTTKHFVDLWLRETHLRRKQIVIEVPSSWDTRRLADLDGETLARLADEYGCDADWEIESILPHDVEDIDVSGPVPEELEADITFKLNKVGDLIESDSGERAVFTY